MNNGARFDTYVIEGERGSGVIGVNGAAARLAASGDLLIIITYAQMETTTAKSFEPSVVHVDERNRIVDIGSDPASPAGEGSERPPHA
ncbi:MAG TPA: aspartate 1-decarboxylase [Enterobacter roggenkampii]|nr:aspartate 1-decarboxylase [Enterobacter roggenkampii]